MKDLLKEAIADAKAVRETALANAKLALEEAFTPRLQSMLSAKLAEELSDDEEVELTNEFETEEYAENDPTFSEGEEEHEEAPEEMAEEPAAEAPEETEDDDLDLEEIIRELEMEEAEGEEDMESMEENEEEDMESMEEGDYADDMTDEMDEDIDINEIIRSLREEDEEEVEEPAQEEELEEAYNVIRFLKGKINEVNLLNAKLLYSNKLFRNFSLNEGQKMKVIENFDRAHNLREVKLVYSTLAEGFKMPSSKKVVKESFASKPVASTKPAKQVISEGAELANRFKKLAGLK